MSRPRLLITDAFNAHGVQLQRKIRDKNLIGMSPYFLQYDHFCELFLDESLFVCFVHSVRLSL